MIVRALEKPSMPGWIWVLISLKGWLLNASFDVPCESIHSCAHASILHASLSLQLLARYVCPLIGQFWYCIQSDMHFNSDCMLFLHFTRQISFDWFIWCLFLHRLITPPICWFMEVFMAWHRFLHVLYSIVSHQVQLASWNQLQCSSKISMNMSQKMHTVLYM